MASYPLDRADWIQVEWLGPGPERVSLLEVIESAGKIHGLVGNPLEVAVIMRLLLAIAHRVRTPEDSYDWLDVWNSPDALLDGMENYVREHAAAFDLYNEKRPFGQHPGLPHPTATPAALSYDRSRGNNPVFLDGSQDEHRRAISSAEAARALLVSHAYGGSGTGGLNPLNDNKKDTMLAGPLCGRMVGYLEGENLAKTLVLNLASETQAGRPAWERPIVDIPSQTRPEGLADLYTRTTRAARLRPSEDGKHCLAVALYMGQALPTDETDATDPTMPRYVAKDKKVKALRLSPDRASWRSAHILLMAHVQSESRPLRAIEQLRPLLSTDQFPRSQAVRLRLLGVAANCQGPVTEMWRDETLKFGLSVIADDARYEALRSAIDAAETTAARLVNRLSEFAKAYIGGNPDPKAVNRLKDEAAPGLSDFWAEVGPEGERIALDDFDMTAWHQTLRDAADRAFRKAVERLPADARRFRAEFSRSEQAEIKESKKKRVNKTA